MLFASCAPTGSDASALPDLAAFEVGAAVQPLPIDEAPYIRTGPVFLDVPGKAGSHAPAITAFPDGELLCAWYSYDGPGERDGAAIYMSRRPAGSDVWQPPFLHIDSAQADGNPVLYSEGDEVWFFRAVTPGGWSLARIEWQHSTDRGVTWTTPGVLGGPLGANVRFPPVRLASGGLLLPAYDDLLQRSLFFVSLDGTEWSLRTSVTTAAPHENLQPSIVQLDSGRLLAVLRNHGGGWLWLTASDDDGAHWADPIDSGLPNPASPAGLTRLADGRLVLVFNDSNTARTPLAITLSADAGLSWTTPRILADGPGEYAYPAAVQTSDGRIHVVYSNDRTRIEHVEFNAAWVMRVAKP